MLTANYYKVLFWLSDPFVISLVYFLENLGDRAIIFISQEETEAQRG